MKITTPAIIALAQTLEGETIATVRDRRSFQVVVRPKGGGLEFVPARTKRPRRAPPEQIDAVLAIYGKTGSLRKADYQDVSFNASYILALIKHFTDQELQTAEISADKVETQFLHKVAEASTLSQAKLAELLAGAPVMPEKIAVLATVFVRNIYVAAAVLKRANGVCEMCGQKAPFLKASDGTPYLEVHHRVRLASGGEDTITNAIAVCPNCHRKAHYGAPVA